MAGWMQVLRRTLQCAWSEPERETPLSPQCSDLLRKLIVQVRIYCSTVCAGLRYMQQRSAPQCCKAPHLVLQSTICQADVTGLCGLGSQSM